METPVGLFECLFSEGESLRVDERLVGDNNWLEESGIVLSGRQGVSPQRIIDRPPSIRLPAKMNFAIDLEGVVRNRVHVGFKGVDRKDRRG